MQALNLPEPIAAYFRADAGSGLAVAHCFTPDGRVRDEGHTHTGHAAIAAWKDDAAARYVYTVQPHGLERDADHHAVIARVAGNFPGSPVDLRYVFLLEGDKIASLEIRS